VDKRYIVERQGKPFVLYAGLLDEAHSQGLKAIRTQLIQAPSVENSNTAICFAEVTTDRGTFTGLGDASSENVSRMIAPHLLRMAETRAKARALRDAVNVGIAALEELGDDEQPTPKQITPIRPASTPTRQQPATNNWRGDTQL
jgi:hypothetical protein